MTSWIYHSGHGRFSSKPDALKPFLTGSLQDETKALARAKVSHMVTIGWTANHASTGDELTP